MLAGTGADAGAALVGHPDVDMVSFTGSTAVGRQVMAAAAARARGRVHLELGGKAPFVVFDDADLDAAVHGAVAGSLINTGQDCTAATRAYVHRSMIDDFVEGVADLFAGIRLGDPLDPATDLGPLSSARHRDKVAAMVERAAGRRRHASGPERRCPVVSWPGGSGTRRRWSWAPGRTSRSSGTRCSAPCSPCCRSTPTTRRFALANDSPYGLAASAWTRDVHRSLRAAAELRAGTVWINDHIPIFSEMPHGGFGSSGFGKDMSVHALHDYTIVKHVAMDRTAAAHKQWHRTVFSLPPTRSDPARDLAPG